MSNSFGAFVRMEGAWFTPLRHCQCFVLNETSQIALELFEDLLFA
ncbi:hypothetical protein EDE15_4410 [Edaphobacter aggregans]|uniref:Uncharacterized protein n=1 Tax=Edaphobacter aggregans TaxID=570835 RepID=A0A3R9NX12_9BACT|nr:hypothetical protein EDE15_4410 [Edaphobacter aggregans]